jgi:light-regulated signal transduction histidine kinase (bacteriophytochrome)
MGVPEQKIEPAQKVFTDLQEELQIIVHLFEILTRSPEVVTKEILENAKRKVQAIIVRVKDVEGLLQKEDHSDEENSPKYAISQGGTLHPAMILDEVANEFTEQINTQMALYADEVKTLAIPDRDFEYVLKTLFESAVRTQSGMQNKTCEVSVSAKGDSMILQFKDFGRRIPEDIIPYLFDGSTKSKEYGGGYPFYRMKKLLMRARGQVKVLAGQSKFTTFMIKIPFHRGSL